VSMDVGKTEPAQQRIVFPSDIVMFCCGKDGCNCKGDDVFGRHLGRVAAIGKDYRTVRDHNKSVGAVVLKVQPIWGRNELPGGSHNLPDTHKMLNQQYKEAYGKLTKVFEDRGAAPPNLKRTGKVLIPRSINGIPIRAGLPEPPQARTDEFYLVEGADVYIPVENCCHLVKLRTSTGGIALDRHYGSEINPEPADRPPKGAFIRQVYNAKSNILRPLCKSHAIRGELELEYFGRDQLVKMLSRDGVTS
jgi:hypothetical protein